MSDRNHRWFGALLSLAVAACPAWGQSLPAGNPSPFAPGDLKRPIFDTTKPAYDAANQQERTASSVVAEVDGPAIALGEVGDAIKELPASVQSLPFSDLFPAVLTQLVRQQALVIRSQHQALDEEPTVR